MRCDELKKTKNGKYSEYLVLLRIFNELMITTVTGPLKKGKKAKEKEKEKEAENRACVTPSSLMFACGPSDSTLFFV